ncbi:MAG: hypothetical protein AAGE52_16230 [Myxococcota bacterium]
MSALLGMTVEELVEFMRLRDQRLPFEIGAFVALEVCESVIEGPAKVATETVRISDEGVISVYAPPHSATNAEAARSVGEVLARLLVAAGAGVPPVLLQLVEHGPSDGRWDLGRLRDELEASLVPLNRSAARRVLSRLVRDLKRPSKRPPEMKPAPKPGRDLDADLDALLGGDDEGDAVDELLSAMDSDSVDEEMPTQQLPQLDGSGNPIVDFSMLAAKRSPGSPSARIDEEEETAPQEVATVPPPSRKLPTELPRDEGLPTANTGRLSALDDYSDVPTEKKGRWGLYVVLLAVVAALCFGAIFVFRPDVIDRLQGNYVEPDPEAELAEARAEQERLRQEAEAALLARHGNLRVRATSDRAQILMFVGRGPALAENLPIGVAHEFVAIADGKEPTRVVLPASAEWNAINDETQQYELALQTGEGEMPFESLDLGASRLQRGAMGTPTGELGQARIITSPQGARVFLLIGFGSASVSDLPVEEPHELLVFEEGFRAQRVFVGPSDWRDDGDGKLAEVEVTLVDR